MADTIAWSSSDPTVASVDANGRVTALKIGDVTITATLTTTDGRIFSNSIHCSVVVSDNVASVQVVPGSFMLFLPDNGPVPVTSFTWAVGDALDTAVFARNTGATYRAVDGAVGDADINIPRDSHYIGNQRTMLLEFASENVIANTEALEQPFYTPHRSTISANAASAPDGQPTADVLVENTENGSHDLLHGVIAGSDLDALAGEVNCVYSIFSKMGTSNRAWHELRIDDGTGADQGYAYNVSTGVIGTRMSASQVTNAQDTVIAYKDGWYRAIVTVHKGPSFNHFGFGIQPADGVSTNGTPLSYVGDGNSNGQFWGIQVEPGIIATSYIRNTGSAVAQRDADLIYWTSNIASQAMEMQVQFIELGAAYMADAGVLYLGSSGNNTARLYIASDGAGHYKLVHNNGVAEVSSTLGVLCKQGDNVSLRGVLNDDGSVQLFQEFADGTEAFGPKSAALTINEFGAGAQRVYVNSLGDGWQGIAAYINASINLLNTPPQEDTTVASVDVSPATFSIEPAPQQSTVTSAYVNQPSTLLVISQEDWSTLPENGTGNADAQGWILDDPNNHLSLGNDPNGPGNGNYIDYFFNQFFLAGSGPGHTARPNMSVHELFVACNIWLSKDIDTRPANVHKLWYTFQEIWAPAYNRQATILALRSGNGGGYTFPFRLSLSQESAGGGAWLEGNQGALHIIQPETWYRIECYQKAASSDTAGDGIFRLWVNGALYMDYSNAKLNDDPFTQWHVNPVYGGTLDLSIQSINGDNPALITLASGYSLYPKSGEYWDVSGALNSAFNGRWKVTSMNGSTQLTIPTQGTACGAGGNLRGMTQSDRHIRYSQMYISGK